MATVDEKIAALAAKQEAREAAREAEAKDHELARLELLDRFETELGAYGRAFAMVDCGALGLGWIVVKPPEPAAHKRYMGQLERAVMKDVAPAFEEKHSYARSCVAHPAIDQFNALTMKHVGIVSRVVDAANYLATGRREREEGKF